MDKDLQALDEDFEAFEILAVRGFKASATRIESLERKIAILFGISIYASLMASALAWMAS